MTKLKISATGKQYRDMTDFEIGIRMGFCPSTSQDWPESIIKCLRNALEHNGPHEMRKLMCQYHGESLAE